MRSKTYRGGILLPGEASTALSIIAFLFISSGTVLLLLVALVVAGRLLQWSAVANITPASSTLVINAAFAFGYCWIGALLLRAKRLGAVLALTDAGVHLLAVLFSPPVSAGGLLKPALIAIAMVLAWPHLNQNGRELHAATRITTRAGYRRLVTDGRVTEAGEPTFGGRNRASP